MLLLADSELLSGLLPDYFGKMLAALGLVFLVGMLLFVLGWRCIDWVTPGTLNVELVPGHNKQPNMALAVVVGALVLGMSFVLGSTIMGILMH